MLYVVGLVCYLGKRKVALPYHHHMNKFRLSIYFKK